jgi:hypothetical protein
MAEIGREIAAAALAGRDRFVALQNVTNIAGGDVVAHTGAAARS